MYEFKDDQPQPQDTAVPSRAGWPELFVRGIGIVLLLVGLWSSVHVLVEALKLYRDPLRVEDLAAAIEQGSNLDRALRRSTHEETAGADRPAGVASLSEQAPSRGIRLTYFVAWVIALLLLMLITMIAFSAVRTGSELVLQDARLKTLVRNLGRSPAGSGGGG